MPGACQTLTVSQRIVITGAGGQVGRFLAAQAVRDGRDVLAKTSSQWDITDPAIAQRTVRADDVVINCAAYTNVDAAESDEPAAHAVNAVGPAELARACARVGAGLIHISTDYVFSGDFGTAEPRPYRPDDQVGPLSVYGRSKLAGERAVLDALPAATVVRTAWVYTGGSGTDFVAVMRKLAAGPDSVDVVDDQIGSPTYVADLAATLWAVADERPAGIVHAANRGAVSRCEQARAVFAGLGADPLRVRPVSSADHPRPAARPAYSALAAAGVAPLRDWHDALIDALRTSPDNL